MSQSNRYTNNFKAINRETVYPLDEAVKLIKSSGEPNRDKVGQVTKDQLKSIAELKWKDLNAATIESAVSMIEGTAKSMGLKIKG